MSVIARDPVSVPSRRKRDYMDSPPFEIVLVEDAEPDVFLVREALESGGVAFNLRVLRDGEKAVDFIDEIDRAASGPCPHLMLLDLNLPKRTGAQVLEHVKRSERLRDVPAVALAFPLETHRG